MNTSWWTVHKQRLKRPAFSVNDTETHRQAPVVIKVQSLRGKGSASKSKHNLKLCGQVTLRHHCGLCLTQTSRVSSIQTSQDSAAAENHDYCLMHPADDYILRILWTTASIVPVASQCTYVDSYRHGLSTDHTKNVSSSVATAATIMATSTPGKQAFLDTAEARTSRPTQAGASSTNSTPVTQTNKPFASIMPDDHHCSGILDHTTDNGQGYRESSQGRERERHDNRDYAPSVERKRKDTLRLACIVSNIIW